MKCSLGEGYKSLIFIMHSSLALSSYDYETMKRIIKTHIHFNGIWYRME